MITILVEECNEISQDFYDKCTRLHPVCLLKCPGKLCPSGTLIIHGHYTRHVKNPSGKIPLDILRVQCTECSATHAILPSPIVPYSQVPLRDHAAIAAAADSGGNVMDVMEDNPELSPSQVWYILAAYIRVWQQRILSERIALSPLYALTRSCFACYSRPFMQIKKTPNILFPPPT